VDFDNPEHMQILEFRFKTMEERHATQAARPRPFMYPNPMAYEDPYDSDEPFFIEGPELPWQQVIDWTCYRLDHIDLRRWHETSSA
jgi:hypothetical protein